MENLLKPDLGLMVWTVVTFLIMVLILKKIAWGPLLKIIDERESKIKSEMDAAQKNKEQMEQFKAEYERQLSEIEQRARVLVSEAEQKGKQACDAMLKDAEQQSRQLAERTRQQLENEKNQLVSQMRSEVGKLSILATEKLLQKSVDSQVQQKFLQDLMADLEQKSN